MKLLQQKVELLRHLSRAENILAEILKSVDMPVLKA